MNAIKKFVRGTALTLFFLAALLGGTSCSVPMRHEVASKPTVTISPSPVDYKRRVKVAISGSGFKPKQELGLLIVMGGAPSDIGALVKPKPVTNEKGEFSSVWVIDGEIRRKLLDPTSHTIEVTDEEWTPLARATLVFKKPEKEEKKK
ncbi:MAG: hypothetical protein HY695_03805 [Deltaproteobacteria bacterium]|nr:hypothetical protein [Deltaproteobacteria bacterium]